MHKHSNTLINLKKHKSMQKFISTEKNYSISNQISSTTKKRIKSARSISKLKFHIHIDKLKKTRPKLTKYMRRISKNHSNMRIETLKECQRGTDMHHRDDQRRKKSFAWERERHRSLLVGGRCEENQIASTSSPFYSSSKYV